MDTEINKLIAFITRETADKRQLLVMRVPRAGNQLLSGTLAAGETPENSLLRTIHEQLGLADVQIVTRLDSYEQVLEGKDRILSAPYDLEVEPGDSGRRVARLTSGSPVQVIGTEDDYTHVWYNFNLENGVLVPDRRYTGWLPGKFLTDKMRLNLFQLKITAPTPDEWSHKVNYRSNEFYWADMDVELIPQQQGWLDRVRDRLQ